jgi:hypothetical protein
MKYQIKSYFHDYSTLKKSIQQIDLTKLISTPKTNLDKTRVILKICILDTDFMYCPNLSSAQTEFIQN